jgi:lipopolysaccharide transport system ATP-binding protein
VWPGYTKGIQDVWALKDINFEIKRGEAVAIIGRNGGGKSTLLEILTGTLTPTTGEVKVNGRVSALLELGSGFNPEYSGRDNVVLNGLLLGLSKEDILSRFAEIEAFAEIGAAIDRPVKTYSSGMMMRLAFAVQVLCDPDILIIDEALSVGDFFFQQKCLSFIRELCAKGVTLLFVSHDMGTVRDLCDRAVFLQKGKIFKSGLTEKVLKAFYGQASNEPTNTEKAKEPNKVVNEYENTLIADTFDKSFLSHAQWVNSPSPLPDFSVRIIGVAITNTEGQHTTACKMGDRLNFKIMLIVSADISVHIAFGIKNKYDQLITCAGTYQSNVGPIRVSRSSYIEVEFEIKMDIEAGAYSIHFNAGMPRTDVYAGASYDQTPSIGPIHINWNYQSDIPPFTGMIGLPFSSVLKNQCNYQPE